MPESVKDYYRILQVDPSAEQDVIEAAFVRLAGKYQSDKDSSSEGNRRVAEIIEAYEVLRDPAKRAQYDKERSESAESPRRRNEGEQVPARTLRSWLLGLGPIRIFLLAGVMGLLIYEIVTLLPGIKLPFTAASDDHANPVSNAPTLSRVTLVATPPSKGGRIAYVSEQGTSLEMRVMNADGSNQLGASLCSDSSSPITFGGRPRWSPDGRLIALACGESSKSVIYLITPDGTIEHLIDSVLGPLTLSWSPDGKFIALDSTADRKQIYLVNADGRNLRNISNNAAIECCPSWSPDGKLIAFSSNRDGTSGIYIMNLDGTTNRRLTNQDDLQPAWSPDGRFISFWTINGRNFEINITNVDGTRRINLFSDSALSAGPVWSPDGRSIAFTSQRDGSFGIYTVNADGTELRRLTSGSSPTWSPDGRLMAFQCGDGKEEICVMNADGLYKRIITSGAGKKYSPSWSPR